VKLVHCTDPGFSSSYHTLELSLPKEANS